VQLALCAGFVSGIDPFKKKWKGSSQMGEEMVVKIDLHPVSPFILRIDSLIFYSREKINAKTSGRDRTEEEGGVDKSKLMLDILKDIMI
jgi:hypothetical protein